MERGLPTATTTVSVVTTTGTCTSSVSGVGSDVRRRHTVTTPTRPRVGTCDLTGSEVTVPAPTPPTQYSSWGRRTPGGGPHTVSLDPHLPPSGPLRPKNPETSREGPPYSIGSEKLVGPFPPGTEGSPLGPPVRTNSLVIVVWDVPETSGPPLAQWSVLPGSEKRCGEKMI